MRKVTIYSRFGRIITVVVAILCGYVIFDSVLNGFLDWLAFALPIGVSFVVWLLFWSPKVVVDEVDVTILNPFRRIVLPWRVIDRVDTKYSLTLHSAGRSFQAWAAPAPSRFRTYSAHKLDGAHLPESSYLAGTVRPGDLITTDSGQAAFVIRMRLEQIRDGHVNLPDPTAHAGPSLSVTWRLPEIVVVTALALLTVGAWFF